MPLPIALIVKLGRAHDHLKEGRVAEAQAETLQAEVAFAAIEPALTPTELLTTSAALASLLKQCGNMRGALPRLERVCALALQLDPNDSQTVGDLCDLAECYEALGQLDAALRTFEQARPIAEGACPEYLPRLDARIHSLFDRLVTAIPRVAPHAIAVELDWLSINYALAHAGLARPRALWIDNRAPHSAQVSVQVRVPGYTVGSVTVPVTLAAGERLNIAPRVDLPFLPDRLMAQAERARASVEIAVDGRPPDRWPIWILSAHECSWEPGDELSLAVFVHPNNPAVRLIASQALRPLKALTGHESFRVVRESSRPDRIDRIVEAIYQCLCDGYDLIYDYEPPSWEPTSQRIRLADEVVVNRLATCVDLMLLVTAVLEHVLVGCAAQPVMILTGDMNRHALAGCWRDRPRSDEDVITDSAAIAGWIEAGDLLVIDPTGLGHANPFTYGRADFAASMGQARRGLESASRLIAVNLAAVRPDPVLNRLGITPLPSRPDPAYSPLALHALWLARQAWAAAPTAQIQSAHLLLALLRLDGGAGARLFDTLARLSGNPLVTPEALAAYLEQGLRQVSSDASNVVAYPPEADGLSRAKLMARQEAGRLAASMVDDVHLLFALLRQPGASITKALSQRKTSPAECLTLLDRLYPATSPVVRSEFPTEVEETTG